MTDIDLEQVAILMRERRERAIAFRQKHEATFPALFEADEHYQRGGPRDVLIREIEATCQKRPDLADEIQKLWRWTKGDKGKIGFIELS